MRWTEIDSTAAEVEMGDLLYGLVRMLKPGVLVETGTYKADTAKRLGEALRDNAYGWGWTCDVEWGEAHLEKIADLPMTYVKCSSLDLPELREADFVFSDSGQLTRPKEYELVKPGCVFVVHDTGMSFTGNAQQDWLGQWVRVSGGLTFPAGRGFGILIKPNPLEGGT